MDRLNRTLAGCGLALLVAATGSSCRSTQSQVPPGRPYTNDGRQGTPVGFSSEPHPMSGAASTSVTSYAAGAPGATGQLGTPTPGGTASFGAPAGHMYGPPGSSPLGSAAGQSPAMGSSAPESGGASTSPPSDGAPVGVMGGPQRGVGGLP
jgi:hypothetical protein